jgi:hypothetical protein
VSVECRSGLAPEHQEILTDLATTEAANYEGSPSVFAIAERLREWLLEHNAPGLDDPSMHAQMMRKKRQEEQQQELKSKVRSILLVHFGCVSFKTALCHETTFWLTDGFSC